MFIIYITTDNRMFTVTVSRAEEYKLLLQQLPNVYFSIPA